MRSRRTKMTKRYLYQTMLRITIFIALVAGASAQQSTPAKAGRTLVRAGEVLDVHTGKETAAMTVIVTGDRSTAIAPTAQTPAQAGDREIDLTRYTVMPGLIDVHTHL